MNPNTQSLPVKLTDEELIIRSNELAVQVQELAVIESQKKSANDSFKDQMSKAEIKIADLARVVRKREEYRDVEVKEIRNMDRLTMDTIRLDTGEVVSYRDMKGHERNLGLFPQDTEKQKVN